MEIAFRVLTVAMTGDEYEGEVSNGKFQGSGRYTWKGRSLRRMVADILKSNRQTGESIRGSGTSQRCTAKDASCLPLLEAVQRLLISCSRYVNGDSYDGDWYEGN